VATLRTEPVATVTDADIDRLVRRDYAPDQVVEVLGLLEEYSSHEAARVRAAVLKLAAGSVDQLLTRLQVALIDYRDVLAPAEYPEYLRHSYAEIQQLSEADLQKLYDQDWQQYQSWFGSDID